MCLRKVFGINRQIHCPSELRIANSRKSEFLLQMNLTVNAKNFTHSVQYGIN